VLVVVTSVNKQITYTPTEITLSDGSTIISTYLSDLDLPTIPSEANISHTFPRFPADALLSLSILCDSGCTATWIETSSTSTIVMTSTHPPSSPLWIIDLPPLLINPSITISPAEKIRLRNTGSWFYIQHSLLHTTTPTIAQHVTFICSTMYSPHDTMHWT